MAYIDRSELNAKIEEEVYLTKSAKSAFQRIVYNTPSADVAPVRHGRWIEHYAGKLRYFECSICGRPENKHTAITGRYCWSCGAKMDGGTDNG